MKLLSIMRTLGLSPTVQLFFYKLMLKRTDISFSHRLQLSQKKHSLLLHFIDSKLSIAKRYDFYLGQKEMAYAEKTKTVVPPNTIWIFWWQGEEAMPPLVRKCFERAKQMASNWNVVLLSKDNLADYLTIPQRVLLSVVGGVKVLYTYRIMCD